MADNYQERMDGVNIAFDRLSPIMESQAEEIERLNKEKEVKKNEVKKKEVEFKADIDTNFKFDEVVTENTGQLSFKTFDFSIFKGLKEEIEEVEKEYKRLEARGIYSKDYLSEARNDAIVKIHDVKLKYWQKAKDQLSELRTPVMTTQAMTSHDEQMNMMKRLNNNIVCSELMRTASVEDLELLFEDNKDVVEVRTMIKMRANHIYRVVKNDRAKNKAINLYATIKAYEKELKNPEYFNELDSIEANLDYILNRSENTYPLTLENGFDGFKSKRYFA